MTDATNEREALRVSMTAEVAAFVAERVAAARASDDDWVRAVGRLGCLPLYADVERAIGLTADGNVVRLACDDGGRVRAHAEPTAYWRYFALVAGARRYAELDALLPAPEAGDSVCPTCLFESADALFTALGVLCRCCGAGWLPRAAASEALQLLTRAAEVEDLAAIDEIERGAFPECAYTPGVLRQWFDVAPGTLLVAVRRGSVVGYALGAVAAAGSLGWILSVAVRPQDRRQGVGHLLVADLLGRLTAAGATSARLTVASRDAGGAALSYEFGFRDAYEDPDYYGRGQRALVMECDLPRPGLRAFAPRPRTSPSVPTTPVVPPPA